MNDFLEYLKDLESGNTDVAPSDLAPEIDRPITASGSEYDETNDKELINESIKLIRLYEASRSERIVQYSNTTDNPSYEDFMNSKFGDPKDTETGFNRDFTWLKNKGYIGTNTSFKNSGGTSYNDNLKSKKSGPYERNENYVPGNYADQVDFLSNEYGEAELKGSADEMFQDVVNVVKNIILKKTDKIHGIIFGDPGVGKTFEVTETCKKYMPQSPSNAEYVYESGDIGSSMSSLVPFFYFHSQNKIIILDDNDKMIMKGLSQDIMNIMKAIMDPKAATDKPVTVRGTLLKAFQNQYDDLVAASEDNSLKEGVEIEIDLDALKENRFVLYVDGKQVIYNHISLKESHDLQNQISPYTQEQLREIKTNRQHLDDFFEEDNNEDNNLSDNLPVDFDEDKDNKPSFPRKFMFNSSIIFISNLEADDINTAVLDRCEAVEVKLSLEQFLERLGKIYGGLAKIRDGSQISQHIRNWSKKSVYTSIGISIEAWQANKPMWGTPIEINRKLTFRMFDEFVSAWERYAMDNAENKFGKEIESLNQQELDKLAIELIPQIIRRKIIPFMKTVVK